jgi:hypothetical protein
MFGYGRSERHLSYLAVRGDRVEAHSYAFDTHGPRGIIGAADALAAIEGFRVVDEAPSLCDGRDLHYIPADRRRDAGLYDRHGQVIPESRSYSICDHRDVGGPKDASLAAHDFVVERRPSVYLGYCADQFGHFLSETVSRFWIIPNIDPRAYNFVIHNRMPHALRSYMVEVLELFGIPPGQVIQYNFPVRFEHILVPAQGIIRNDAVWTRFIAVAARLGAELDAPLNVDPERPVYFTKRLQLDRAIVGEADLIEGLQSRGVQILDPETLSVRERIMLYNNCRTVIGVRASAQYLGLFSSRPLHHVYIEGRYDRHCLMIDAAKGNRSTWIHGEVTAPPPGKRRRGLAIDATRCLEVLDSLDLADRYARRALSN